MLDHVELYVSDLARAERFWTPLLQQLGYAPRPWSGGVNYDAAGADQPYLSLLQVPAEHAAAGYHRQRVGLNHLAFRAASRQQVDAIRQWLQAHGHPLLYDERYPYATGPGYYALFCEDPDRIKIEIVAPHQD